MSSIYSVYHEMIKGYKIEYVDTGAADKAVLIFAHGLGANLRHWNEQISFFSDNYRVIAFSLQGHGNSSKAKSSAEYAINLYGDVALGLLEQLNINSCTWIGNSMGGVIGYEVLRKQPDIIEKLITNGTAPELKLSKKVLKAIRIADKLLIGLIGYERYIDIAVKVSFKDAKKRQNLKELFMCSNSLTMIESHQLLGDYSYLDTIEKSKADVIFILTPKDKNINKAINLHRKRLSAMPNVTLIEKEHGGHLYNMEIPDEYNQTIKDILWT